jgi:hypothetical protein
MGIWLKIIVYGYPLDTGKIFNRIFYHEPTQTNTNLLLENHLYPSKSLKYKRSGRFFINIGVRVRGVRKVRG